MYQEFPERNQYISQFPSPDFTHWSISHSHSHSPPGFTQRANRSCFKWTISYNSGNLYRICTTVGTKILFNAPIQCTKLQLDPSMHLCFIAIFLRVQKDEEWEEKWRNLNKTLGACIAKTAIAICIKFGRLAYLASISAANLVEFE